MVMAQKIETTTFAMCQKVIMEGTYSESQKMVGDLTVMCEDFRSYIINPSFRVALICAENFVQDYKHAPSLNEKGKIYIYV